MSRSLHSVKMFRHIEELPSLVDGMREGSILNSEAHIVDDYYVPRLRESTFTNGYVSLALYHGATVRAAETAYLVKDKLIDSYDLTVRVEQDLNISPLKHGYYRDTNSMMGRVATVAQDMYIHETFDKGNPYYRHGDPVMMRSGNYLYPELKDNILVPGECQADMSIRVYSAVKDIIDRGNSRPKEAIALSTHYVIMSRLLALQAIARCRIEDNNAYNWKIGELYKMEWDVGLGMTKQEGFKGYFKNRGYIFDIDIESIATLEKAIDNELEYVQGKLEKRSK